MREVVITLIVGIVILASLFYVYSVNVTVRHTYIIIQYGPTETGYLTTNIGQTISPTNFSYPGFTIGGLKQESIQISLRSNATSSHQIRSIQISNFGFTIIQLLPSTPISIPAQTNTLNFAVRLQCPFLGYDDNISIQLILT